MSLDKLFFPVEARIARVLVRALVSAGFRIRVDNSLSILSDNPARIEAAMAHTDEEHLIVYHPETKLNGWLFLVYGNGEDLITDYTTNLEDEGAASAPVLRMIFNEIDADGDSFAVGLHSVEDALWISKLDAEREKSA